jgi:hypothetical protein
MNVAEASGNGSDAEMIGCFPVLPSDLSDGQQSIRQRLALVPLTHKKRMPSDILFYHILQVLFY